MKKGAKKLFCLILFVLSTGVSVLAYTPPPHSPDPPDISGITDGEFNTDQTFSVSGSEPVIEYSLNNGSSWNSYSGPVTLSGDGTYRVTARQSDGAGTMSGNAAVITVVINTSSPEIDLAQGNSCPSGSQYNFGSVNEGEAGVSIPFTIRNTGSATLTVSGISLSNNTNFNLSASSSYTIYAGNDAVFYLAFTPSATGSLSASLTINSNDANEGTYILNLVGTGVENDVTPPNAPTVSGIVYDNDARPEWSWNEPADAVQYRYSFTASGNWTVTTATSYRPAEDLENGTYTLYVQAVDASGNWSSSGSKSLTVDVSTTSDFKVASHYYDKGTFDKDYSSYDSAFSDNHTDEDVEIHSYIVINFNKSIRLSSITSDTIVVKRLNMTDNSENNYNEISGTVEVVSNSRIVFKPSVEFYANPNGTFDWDNPNWNGLKPNYEYSVELSSAIKDTDGNSLSEESCSWEFKTIDIDYGLYWFKNGSMAVKYVPGRELPSEYYNPSRPTIIYSHGWGKTSVNYQNGNLRDYRRESFFHSTEMYYSGDEMDLVSIWKNPWENYEGKAWNFGAVYWNQLADDDYANLSKPQKAEAKIWSTNGKGGMEYAVRKWSGSSWTSANTLVTTNSPTRPMSVIFSDIIVSACSGAANSELRLFGHSLGSQMAAGISYCLKEQHRLGNISSALFPKRLVLVDPYFRPGSLQNSWSHNHPAAVNLGANSDSTGAMAVKIIEDILDYSDNQNGISFVVAYYDVSGASDKNVFLGNRLGDTVMDLRDIADILYLKSSWLPGSELDNNYLAHRHVNGRLWYLWQYAFPPPAEGFSASSSDADIQSNMNYYNSSISRYSIYTGIDTPTPEDDNYTLEPGSWQD
ncbi:MAG: choice-of-anchor D domain-containing protein [bacterium]|nr:choice-of-anchor D domain-containing protein [bacterium]